MTEKEQQNQQGQEQREQQAPGENGASPDADDAAGVSEELERLRREARENHENYLRAMAEVENVRRRGEREVANAHKFGLEKFVAELLPVRDSLEMGLKAGEQEQADVAALREGTELTLKMLGQVLEKFGVEEINPEGEPFNPDRHEAVSTLQSAEAEPDTVVEVMQKGYLLNERVVRPAMVVVARPPAEAEGSEGNKNQ
jgi:molecular chaperone GrpE